MDRLVFYLSYPRADGDGFARRVAEELRRSATPVAVLPDPDTPDRSGIAWLGGCDAVLFLLTPAGAVGQPSCAAELARAAELGKPIVVIREDEALRVPPSIVAPELIFPRQPSAAEREAIWHLIRDLGSPAEAAAEQRRALAAWRAATTGRADPEIVGDLILAPIEREIAQHEARLALGDRAGRAELRRVESRLEELATRDRDRRGRYAGGYLPDRPGNPAGLEEVADAVVAELAVEERALLTLNGSPGIGKTAVAGELRTLLSAVAGESVPVLYVSAYGNAPLTATMLVDALATEADAPSGGDAVSRLVRDSSQSWVAKFDQVLDALGRRPVVLVVDDADHLFEVTDGSVRTRRFLDPAIRGMLRGSLTRNRHRLRWLLIGRELPDLRPLERRRGQVGTVRLRAISAEDGVRLLRSLDPERLVGLGGANEQHLSRLHQLAAGRPRALELVLGALRTHPSETVPSILALLDGHSDDPQAVLDRLFDLVLDGLGRGHRRVVQALAAFAAPVPAAWVDVLLAGVLPGYASEQALRHLAEIRVVRRYGERFALPRSECRRALARLPHGRQYDRAASPRPSPLTELLLCGLAASCFETYLRLLGRTPVSVEDLEPELRLLQLLIRTERFDDAIERMAVLEERYLEDWSQSHVLIPARHELQGKFVRRRQAEVSNLSKLAAAYTQLGEHEQAGRMLDRIDGLRGPDADPVTHEHELRLRLQRAGNLFDLGHVGEAAKEYKSACAAISPDDMPGERIRGHNGLMLCLGEEGKFAAALVEYEIALPLLRTTTVSRAAVTAELKLNAVSILAYAGRTAAARRTLDDVAREAGADAAIAGLCEIARATFAIDDNDFNAASGHARNALMISGRRHQVQISREAGNRLALAQLCAGKLEAAREAAQAAVRTPDSRRALGAFALRGLIAFREDDAATAVAALQTAAARAHHLVVRESRNFALLDWYGLVLSLLAYYEEADLSLAVEIYRRAREITPAPTAVSRSVRLLHQVEKGRIEPGFLDAAVEAARGSA